MILIYKNNNFVNNKTITITSNFIIILDYIIQIFIMENMVFSIQNNIAKELSKISYKKFCFCKIIQKNIPKVKKIKKYKVNNYYQ